MSRHRTVRFKYPASFVALARMLATECKLRDVASCLSVPLTTVYRWAPQRVPLSSAELEPGWTHERSEKTAAKLNELIDTCESKGFVLRTSVQRLIPKVFGPKAQRTEDQQPGRNYNFLSKVSNQIVIGELSFPNGTRDWARYVTDVVDLANKNFTRVENRLLLAKMEMDQHYYARWSCDRLAHIVGMSKFRFIRAFRAAFGSSPIQYVNQVRVERAKHMLALTDQSLQMIALSVGFATSSSLTRAFRRFAGASPGEFLPRLAPAAHNYLEIRNAADEHLLKTAA
jgi:AraC-like DNA-binding protein